MDRRHFVTSLIALPGLLAARRLLACPADAADAAPASAADEPGAPLRLTGVLYAADGKTPLPGMRLFVYHTRADGLYGPPGTTPRDAVHQLTVTTDRAGRYALHTIVPGH